MKFLYAALFAMLSTPAFAATYSVSGILTAEDYYNFEGSIPNQELYGTVEIVNGDIVAWTLSMSYFSDLSMAASAIGASNATTSSRIGVSSSSTVGPNAWRLRTSVTEGDLDYTRTVSLSESFANFEVWNYDWGARRDTFGSIGYAQGGPITFTRISPVPVPATGLLLATGLLALRRYSRTHK